MVDSSAAVAFIVILSVVVVFLGLVSGKFWYQNRSLKRRIEYYIGVLDMVKRHVDFAIFSDPTTELQESHQSEEETKSQTPGTPGGEGVQAKTLQPLSGDPSEYMALATSASVPPQQPSIPQQTEDGRREEEEEGTNEYSVLSRTESQGLQTLRRAADYLELTLQDPSLSMESSLYTPLVWLKRKRSKPKERQDNRFLFGQRIDYRRNPVSPVQARYMTPFSVAPESASALGQWGGRPGQDLVVGGGGGGGRLPATGKNIRDKWQQRQSAMISDELLTNFRSRANTQEDDGTSQQQQQQQQQQPKANYAAANRGHGEEGALTDMEENAKLGDSLSIPPTPQHNRNQRHPVLSSDSHQLTDRRKGLGSEEEGGGVDLTAVEKTADGVSGQDKAAKYVNINYIEKATRKKAKSSKYTNLPF